MRHFQAEAKRQSGLTVVELLIVSVILLVLAGAIGTMAVRGQDAQDYVERQGAVTTTTQDLIERIRQDIGSSTRLWGNDVEGDAFLNGIDRERFAGLEGERLPLISSTDTFKKDVIAKEKTGNVLLFAVHDRTDTFDLNEGAGEVENVRVAIYRIHAYYLHARQGADPAQSIDGLDLVRWVSEPLADRMQIEAIAEPAKKERLLVHLYGGTNPDNPLFPYPPVRLLWQPGEEFGQAFRIIRESGQIDNVEHDFVVPADQRRTKQLLTHLGMSVASNLAGDVRGIGKFGIVQDVGAGFPHGFEVQIVGPAAARQVLAHLTVVSNDEGRHRAWLDLTGVAETRDL